MTPAPGTTHFNNTNIDENAIQPDDATWILTSAFIIFTMQSGFGLLEAGLVSSKNETNIMVKNAIDVIYGGLSYWMFGFAISFGELETSNGFMSWQYFFVDSVDEKMGLYAKYFFQLSFATTATTIVSGAMAERVDIKAYVAFSFLNTISYAFPAHWLWDESGFLKKMGAVDVAGCGPVHLVGGVAALVAAIMLGPRKNKFDQNGRSRRTKMASPTNVLLGTFMLWWGWLGFNCGSTFGTSGNKWKIASRSAVVTINGSIGGGIFGMMYSYMFHKKKLLVNIFVTGILGGLVSVTAICAVTRAWEALIIGTIGSAVAIFGLALEERFHIDDPVGAFPTHAMAAVWGLIATALFSEKTRKFSTHSGVLKGGPWKFLGVQLLAVVACATWSAFTTFLQLLVIDRLIGLRMSDEEEELGADYCMHDIKTDDDWNGGKNSNGGSGVGSGKAFGFVNVARHRRNFELKPNSVIDANKFLEISSRDLSGKGTEIRNDVAPSSQRDSLTDDATVSFDEHGITPEGTGNEGFHNS